MRSGVGWGLAPLNALAQATAEPEGGTGSKHGQGAGNDIDFDRLTGARQGPGAEKPGSGGEPDIRESFAIEDGVADDGRAKVIGWIDDKYIKLNINGYRNSAGRIGRRKRVGPRKTGRARNSVCPPLPVTLPVQISAVSGFSRPSLPHAELGGLVVRLRDPLASTTRLPRDS